MPNRDTLLIRPMNVKDIELVIEWAAAEGWNPGLHDARCFYTADPEGFLVGEMDGMAVATMSAVRYGPHFGFIGLNIVKPEHRKKGFSRRLWAAAMERLKGRTVGLDAVEAQLENYKLSGFEPAYLNTRYEGKGGGTFPKKVVRISCVPLSEVVAYDRKHFFDERREFLRAWISQPGAEVFGWIERDCLKGYGVVRPCRTGFKIGPLFADREEIADQLIEALATRVGTAPLFIDVPSVNPLAKGIVDRRGMRPVFETTRMYAGGNGIPDMPLHKVYGLTTLELG